MRGQAKRTLTVLSLVLLSLFAAQPPFAEAQGCSPRPRVGVSAASTGPGGLRVTLTAGAGLITSIQFGTAQNAVVTIGGSSKAPPFTFAPAPPAPQIVFDVTRQGGAGVPVTVPLTLVDGCGPWQTFIGGGGDAWPRARWSESSLTFDLPSGGMAQRSVTISGNRTIDGGMVAIEGAAQPLMEVDGTQVARLDASTTRMIIVRAAPPANVTPGTYQGMLSLKVGGVGIPDSLPVTVNIRAPSLSPSSAPATMSLPATERLTFSANGPAIVGDELLIRFRDGTSVSAIQQLLAANGAVDIVGTIPTMNLYQVRLATTAIGLDAQIQALESDSSVLYASRNYLSLPSLPPPSEWTGGDPSRHRAHDLIQLPAAWDLISDTSSVRVGVLDVGFDVRHSELIGRAPNAEIGGSRTPDLYLNYHGNYVSSILGAGANDSTGRGVAGVIWNSPMDLRAPIQEVPCWWILLGGDYKLCREPGVARIPIFPDNKALEYIKELRGISGLRVINMSFGGHKGEANKTPRQAAKQYEDVFNETRERYGNRILFVLAAGNEGKPADQIIPATLGDLPNVVVVAAVNPNGTAMWSDSNYGDRVWLAAPGESIYSSGLCMPLDTTACIALYDTHSGTSAAAPFVSGVAALLYARAQQMRLPEPSATQVREWLRQGAVNGKGVVCRDLTPAHCTLETDGLPVLNAYQSLLLVGAPPATLAFTTPTTGGTATVPFTTQPVITVKDQSGGVATVFNGPVTLTLKAGTTTVGAVLNGITTVNAVNGVATFSGLSIDKSGTPYYLTASASGLPPVDSAAFTVRPPDLAFTVQPSGGLPGVPFSTQPVVTAVDVSNRPVTSFNGAVTLAIKEGTTTVGAALNGTVTVNAINGVATFSGLSIDRPGTPYILKATAQGVGAIESAPFSVLVPGQRIQRVSTGSDGTQANRNSYRGVISADGRFVAFSAEATNLVPPDSNGLTNDVFVKDRHTGTTELVSAAIDGIQSNGYSDGAILSADGRYVAFYSYATNLVPGDTNGVADAFVKDRQTGVIERVSTNADGTQGNGDSGLAGMTPDGRFVVIISDASNLLAGDTNGTTDIFVKDRQTGTVQRVNTAADGTQANNGSYLWAAISGDGRYVAFTTQASNLVPRDTNGAGDAFVKDLQTGAIERVSVAADGTQSNQDTWGIAINADGRYIAFNSDASNLVAGYSTFTTRVYVKDRQTGAIETMSFDLSSEPSLSADGRFVAFTSRATNLVSGDTNAASDAFVKDRQTGVVERVSTDAHGVQANDYSRTPTLSADGRYVVFYSPANNLVPDDSNIFYDLFVVDRSLPIAP